MATVISGNVIVKALMIILLISSALAGDVDQEIIKNLEFFETMEILESDAIIIKKDEVKKEEENENQD